jgi:hypothetical protein
MATDERILREVQKTIAELRARGLIAVGIAAKRVKYGPRVKIWLDDDPLKKPHTMPTRVADDYLATVDHPSKSSDEYVAIARAKWEERIVGCCKEQARRAMKPGEGSEEPR